MASAPPGNSASRSTVCRASSRHSTTQSGRTRDQLLSLTERIDRFQHRNLGVKFAAPWATLTGKWEVSEPNRAAVAYDNGFVMMDDLEKRYPPKPEAG
jgi:hypothetical protein